MVIALTLVASDSAFAQGTTGTFNGRVVDQAGAVLQGAAVSATNVNTGFARTTTTNDEGLYSFPGLVPGVYTITVELARFSAAKREQITLPVNTTLTIDLQMSISPPSEALTVTASALIIETTQSTPYSRVQAKEVENLPQVTRNLNSLIALLPQATPSTSTFQLKTEIGGVSFGGNSGRSLAVTIDGADNKDHYSGGMMMNYTQEAIAEFQVATTRFSAADGRTGGASVAVITKSGTNALRGTGFLFDRNKAFIARDFFQKQNASPKPDFHRTQYGGSIGGPVIRNKIFFFGAVESFDESIPESVSANELSELRLMESSGAQPRDTVESPFWNVLYNLKAEVQVGERHSLMGRFAGQRNEKNTTASDAQIQSINLTRMWSLSGQHGWMLSNRALNTVMVHYNDEELGSDDVLANGQLYFRSYPDVVRPGPRLSFPGNINVGSAGGSNATIQRQFQVRDDLSLLLGNHSFRVGGSYTNLPEMASTGATFHFGSLTFFDVPSVIFGLAPKPAGGQGPASYPQGLATPGAVRVWSQRPPEYLQGSTRHMSTAALWFQDDWRIRPRLTLNLGVRYDRDFNWWDNGNLPNNATYKILKAIGSPYGVIPDLPEKNVSPRLGFAYDLSGDGRRVLRGGYGLYFDQMNTSTQTFLLGQNYSPVIVTATMTQQPVGSGPLATYRYGIDPLPNLTALGALTSLPLNTAGQWLDPNLSDPYSHQYHVGYSHELAANTVVSADFTHVAGRNGWKSVEINPIVNGVRVLRDALVANGFSATQFAGVTILASNNRNRYDALTIELKQRIARATFRAHYTLSGAFGYGGQIGGGVAAGGAAAQNPFDIFGAGEWGPTANDERHRLVFFGVFDLPLGFQASPIYQLASARPYTLRAGSDLNGDGNNTDRYVDPATGQQVSVNSARGDVTSVFDLRVTKFFDLRRGQRVGLFIEGFNLFNTANFGNAYGGTATTVATFQKPTGGFIPQVGYPRQLQLGARFLF
jgi:hypothetical protein